MRREKNKKKRIKHRRHIEVLMTISLIPSERSRHNKSNDKKKSINSDKRRPNESLKNK